MVCRLTEIADIPSITRLTAAEGGGSPAVVEARLKEDLALAERCTVVADDDGQISAFGRVRFFEPAEPALLNVAPTGFYVPS